MLHYLSKLTTLLWQPLTWVVILLALGVLLLCTKSAVRQRWGRRLCVAALAVLLAIGWHPFPDALIAALEDRFAPPPGDLSGFHGMVVLGGAFGGDDGRDHGQPILGCAGERVVIPVPLMNQYSKMQLLFSGGDARLFVRNTRAEADVARAYFERMGTDMTRVITETKSRNTFENAVFSKDTPGIDARARWLLVTSAAHMPRALATFQKAGWNVTPYPVDYETVREASWFSYSLHDGVNSWHVALREYLGLAVYKMLGRI
jgi:uncharacterized SAM-binding protein YcdF (DUF218 family)